MVDKKKMIQLDGSTRRPMRGVRKIGATDKDAIVEVTIRIRPKDTMPDIMTLGAQMPQDRSYLTQEQFKQTFGADADDVAKVEAFAHDHGLTVKRVHMSSRVVKLEGTAAAFSAAFGVKLNDVRMGKATVRQRTGAVMIPAELKDIIVGVHGLDNRPVAKPHFRRSARRKGAAAPRNAADGSLSVTEIARLYNFPTDLTGQGQCIAIIELNDLDRHGKVSGAGFFAGDITGFFKQIKTPKPSVVSVGVDGGVNRPGKTDSDGEVVLDIEVAGGVAPGAKIAVYFAPNTTNGFIDAVKAAAHDAVRRPSVISISWGGAEDPDGEVSKQFLDGLNEAIHDAGLMGITVCIAAGDDGSADMGAGWDGQPHTDFPASSPFALACGGTKLQASSTGITSEVVWNEGRRGGAGGGGISNFYPRPPYQTGIAMPKSPSGKQGRGVPDLAGNADPATGYQIFQDRKRSTVGGTSAVAPLMAGLIALINQRLTRKFGRTAGFINPLIYSAGAAAVFRDIDQGNNDIEGNLNGKYKAGRGWDACTGLGVADGKKLLELLGG